MSVARPRYQEFAPPAPLARHVRCSWIARAGADGTVLAGYVLPDACIDIVWDGRAVIVAGPDTRPVPLAAEPEAVFAGVRFKPGLATRFLGATADELVNGRPALAALWGRSAGELEEQLAAVVSSDEAVRLLEAAVLDRLPAAGDPDPVAVGVAAELGRRGSPRVRDLPRVLFVSERQLRRRCLAAFGYGPKTLDRILRFQRFLALATGSREATLAYVAAAAGYTDQAHLTRECRRLGGTTPAALRARNVRFVQA